MLHWDRQWEQLRAEREREIDCIDSLALFHERSASLRAIWGEQSIGTCFFFALIRSFFLLSNETLRPLVFNSRVDRLSIQQEDHDFTIFFNGTNIDEFLESCEIKHRNIFLKVLSSRTNWRRKHKLRDEEAMEKWNFRFPIKFSFSSSRWLESFCNSVGISNRRIKRRHDWFTTNYTRVIWLVIAGDIRNRWRHLRFS